MSRDRPPPSRLRLVLFAAVVSAGVLLGAELLLRGADRTELIDTHDRDDAVQFVESPLFERTGDRIRTTRYAEGSLVPSSFAADKGDRFRLFVLGASFAMGSPYRMQGAPAVGGGIGDFVQLGLEQSFEEREFEVVTVAAGGQDSTRVLAIALEVLRHEPDALLVATGNNEGAPAPTALRRLLQRQAGYRLLRGLLAGERERRWFVPQDAETEAIRRTFEGNLTALLEAAAERDVPVLLATLPIHLRWMGFDPYDASDLLEDLRDPDVEPTDPDDRPWSEPSCLAGLRLFDAGAWQAALPELERCARRSGAAPELTVLAEAQRILARRFTGQGDAPAGGPRLWDDCIDRGIARHAAGEHEQALAGLADCEDLAEALRWAGLSLAALGRQDEALAALEQSVELAPRNRMRPSFNRFVRSRPGVQLVDLDAVARAGSEGGLPGSDHFLDSCHLNWRGYGAMAGAVLEALGHIEPDLADARLDVEAAGRRWRLPPGDNAEQVRWVLARDGVSGAMLGVDE